MKCDTGFSPINNFAGVIMECDVHANAFHFRSTVKRRPAALAPLNGIKEVGDTSFHTTNTDKETTKETADCEPDPVQRALLKELFQQDIDDTVAEILAEETGQGEACLTMHYGGKCEMIDCEFRLFFFRRL